LLLPWREAAVRPKFSWEFLPSRLTRDPHHPSTISLRSGWRRPHPVIPSDPHLLCHFDDWKEEKSSLIFSPTQTAPPNAPAWFPQDFNPSGTMSLRSKWQNLWLEAEQDERACVCSPPKPNNTASHLFRIALRSHLHLRQV